MSNIQTTNQPIYNAQTGTPLYSNTNNITTTQGQTVNVTAPNQASCIYQYPQTSVYNDPNKQAASGVNIYIYNPSGIGGQNTAVPYPYPYSCASAPIQQAVPATNINTEGTQKNGGKTKQITALTDDYIKSLETYLRSQDATIRQSGITELIKRFEEDTSRYNDPALTALLNIALQDSSPNNRVLAMSVIAGGNANGDENTRILLDNLQKSDKLFGQEAIMANKALLKTAQTRITVPDNSDPQKPLNGDEEKDPTEV